MIDSSVPSPQQNGRCGPARTELYRAGIGACTRFAGIFIALVSALIVSPSSCHKPSGLPTNTADHRPHRHLARNLTPEGRRTHLLRSQGRAHHHQLHAPAVRPRHAVCIPAHHMLRA
jgi:hypothetical protein